jgi:hypothetical protein
MHTLTCPVKMAGTLQRRCADCHCVVERHYLRGLVFHGQARDRLAVLRYAHSLAPRPAARARAPNRSTRDRVAARRLFQRLGILAARADRCRLDGFAARRRAARPFRAKGAQGRRLLSPQGGHARADAADRGMPGRRGQYLRATAGGRQARAQRIGRRTADAASVAARLRGAGRECHIERHRRGARSRRVPLRVLQEQAEGARKAGTHRHCFGRKAARARSDPGDGSREQSGPLVDGAAAQHSRCARLSALSAGIVAAPQTRLQVLRRSRTEAPGRRGVSRGIAGQWHARCLHRTPDLSPAGCRR